MRLRPPSEGKAGHVRLQLPPPGRPARAGARDRLAARHGGRSPVRVAGQPNPAADRRGGQLAPASPRPAPPVVQGRSKPCPYARIALSVEAKMMFLDCPAYLDEDGAARCGLPAEVSRRFAMRSTDGPLESAMIRCPVGHWFNGPIGSLTWQTSQEPDPGQAGVSSRARRDSSAGYHDGLDGGFAVRTLTDSPNEPARSAIRRPNGAPAYYLGRPARLWIAATSPHRGRTVSSQPVDAVTGGRGRMAPSREGQLADAGSGIVRVTRQSRIGVPDPALRVRQECHAGDLGAAGSHLAGPRPANTRPGLEGGAS